VGGESRGAKRRGIFRCGVKKKESKQKRKNNTEKKAAEGGLRKEGQKTFD